MGMIMFLKMLRPAVLYIYTNLFVRHTAPAPSWGNIISTKGQFSAYLHILYKVKMFYWALPLYK